MQQALLDILMLKLLAKSLLTLRLMLLKQMKLTTIQQVSFKVTLAIIEQALAIALNELDKA